MSESYPRKKYFRSRAHCNPLSNNDSVSYPVKPSVVDWSSLGGPLEFLDVGCGFGGLAVALGALSPADAQTDPASDDSFALEATSEVALAYVVRQKPGDPLPQGFSGGRDIWHVHDGDRILSAVQETRPVIGSMIDRFLTQRIIHNDGHTQLSMVHLWLIPTPKGRFASHNPRLAYLDLGLPPDRADDMSIARGLALARREGCDEALDAELWLSGAPRRVVRGIMAECRKAADRVRAARADGPLSVEAEAARQYRRVEDAVQISLTPAEQRRMTAFVEDGPGICR